MDSCMIADSLFAAEEYSVFFSQAIVVILVAFVAYLSGRSELEHKKKMGSLP